VIDLYRWALEDLIAVRAEQPNRFVDFQYKDLLSDPLGQYLRGLKAMGLTITAEDEQAGKDWIEESRRDAHSRHTYTPEDFGVTRAQISEAFKFYTDLYLPAG